MGVNCASLPFFIDMRGFFSRFIIVDPYPVPDSYKYASIILPLTTGVVTRD